MKLRYTPEALCDLQEIKRYIKSELHNPTAANRITKAILDGCGQLKQFPKMGVSIGAKTGYETDLRMLVVKLFLLAVLSTPVRTISAFCLEKSHHNERSCTLCSLLDRGCSFSSDRADGGQNFLCKGDH